ncbi:MAG: hypothetical protein MPJ24_09870 [Pirellulaceae bacterium]|nr:hypothetical protein [Pirellulaceae bacterium]
MKKNTILLILFLSAPVLANCQEKKEGDKKQSKSKTEKVVIDLTQTIVAKEIPFLKGHFGNLLFHDREIEFGKDLSQKTLVHLKVKFDNNIECYAVLADHIGLVKGPILLSKSKGLRDYKKIGMLQLVSDKEYGSKKEGLIALEEILKGHSFPKKEIDKKKAWEKSNDTRGISISKRSKNRNTKIQVTLDDGISSIKPGKVIYEIRVNITFFEDRK